MDGYLPKGRCWNCGRFTRELYMCSICYLAVSQSTMASAYWGYCFGVRKSELVDHTKVYSPCP